ncbi:MAG: hypothetical protein O9287_12925 [Microcystis sp. LE17-20D]|nr:type IIL restriction-modification enzyme MmeI [Microcystis sp. LE17-20D]MCZ8066812.1 hypothetical protein [Microcystis sp. LE17-20D]
MGSLLLFYQYSGLPATLTKAHAALHMAVDAAYGKKGSKTDAERVAFLFTLYEQYTSLPA